jgi:hypothetical protein
MGYAARKITLGYKQRMFWAENAGSAKYFVGLQKNEAN